MIVRWLCEREQCERMSGWCPPFSVCCCGMAVGCAVAGPPSPVRVTWPALHLLGVWVTTAARVVYCSLLGVWRVWVSVSVRAVRVVGYPLRAPPSSWWWVGPSWMGGWHCVVGWHGDGRAGAATLTLPSDVGVPLVQHWRPLRVCMVVLLNGGGGACCGVPVFGLGWHLALLCRPCTTPPFSVFAVTALLI